MSVFFVIAMAASHTFELYRQNEDEMAILKLNLLCLKKCLKRLL